MQVNKSILIETIRKNLIKLYPCRLIPRKSIGDATGGILHPRTCANEDCLGTGIADPIIIKGKVCYEIEQVLEYLEKNICFNSKAMEERV